MIRQMRLVDRSALQAPGGCFSTSVRSFRVGAAGHLLGWAVAILLEVQAHGTLPTVSPTNRAWQRPAFGASLGGRTRRDRAQREGGSGGRGRFCLAHSLRGLRRGGATGAARSRLVRRHLDWGYSRARGGI